MQMDLAMGFRGKLNNIILLNEHSSKMTPNYLLLCSIFSVLIRDASPSSKWQQSPRRSTG